MDQFSRRQNNLCKAELIPCKVLTRLVAAAKLINPWRQSRQSRQALGPGSVGQPWTSGLAGRPISGRGGARPSVMGARRDPWPRWLRTRRPAVRRRRGASSEWWRKGEASLGTSQGHPRSGAAKLELHGAERWGQHGMLPAPSPASADGETTILSPKKPTQKEANRKGRVKCNPALLTRCP